MGISGLFLKKVSWFNSKKTLKDVKEILNTLNFAYCIDSVSTNEDSYNLGINDPVCKSDFCMYIFDNPKTEYLEDDNFSWISPNLYTAILIEDISENEKSVLKILYEYFKLYPNEYFYSEEEWFYDKNNIERIYFENPYDSKWCYRNPKEKR